MSSFKIIIKVGPTSARDKKTFDSASNPAMRRLAISEILKKAIEAEAADPAYKKFVDKMGEVQDFIRKDLERFSVQALKFFFSRKSSLKDQPLRIAFSEFSINQTSGLGFKSAFVGGFLDKDITTLWPALSSKTIKNKRGNTTFFVHSGELFDTLSRELFPFFQATLSPTIRVVKEDVPVETGKTTKRIARVDISVAASKKGVNLGNVPALKTGNFSTTGSSFQKRSDFSLIQKYLGEEVAFKLTNFGEKRESRPLVTPLLGYYVVNRFPIILEAALRRHFKVKPPKR